MRLGSQASVVAALLCFGCTDDSRPSASKSQIEAALPLCGIEGAKITVGIKDVTTDFVVEFASHTTESARDCFQEAMRAQNLIQTTGWTDEVTKP